MKKVLIISYSFPPLNNIAARRFSELAEHMILYGVEPYILTTNSSGSLQSNIDESKVIRVGAHIQNSDVVEQAGSEKKFFKKILGIKRKLGLNSRLFNRTQFNWHRQVQKLNKNFFKEYEFDLIIGSYGPGSALSIGKYLSKKLNIPWIADFRDLGALFKEKNEKRNVFINLIDKLHERYLMKSVVGITTVSKALKEELYQTYQKPTEVIYNGWNTEDHVSRKSSSISEPYIFYAGRFYKHQLDSINLLLEALKTTDINLKIRSLGPREFNDKILVKARELQILKKVEILPPASPNIIKEESFHAKYNLVLEDLDKTYEWKKGTLTGKFLPLLTQNPDIIAIARNDSEIGEILMATNKGRLYSTSEEITHSLLNPFKGQINKKEVQLYSKKYQAKKLVSFINDVSAIMNQ